MRRAIESPQILAFVIGEVIRQRHNVETAEGARRVIWLSDAWDFARALAPTHEFPTIEHVLELGKLIEPWKNANGLRRVDVTVRGERLFAPAHIPRLMEKLWDARKEFTPDEFYFEFEKIHPFVDGNGRTGKIIHNWMLKKLEDPVLVRDFFGHGVP